MSLLWFEAAQQEGERDRAGGKMAKSVKTSM